MNVPETELNYKVGDRIACWDEHECIRKEMWLASKLIQTKEVKKNVLEIISVGKDEDD